MQGIMLLIAAVIGTLLGGHAAAQVPSHPDAKSPLKENLYLRHENAYRWDLNLQVFLRGGSFDVVQGRTLRTITPTIRIEELEIILPVAREGGFYWETKRPVESRIRLISTIFNGIAVQRNHEFDETLTPKLLRVPDTDAAYAVIGSDLQHQDIQRLHLKQLVRVVSADTRFDERKAEEIPWPNAWPDEAEKMLLPVVDRVVNEVDQDGVDAVALLVNRWTEGQDPKSIPQITLVKYLTGHVLDYVKVGRPKSPSRIDFNERLVTPFADGGEPISASGIWTGLNVRSADQVALNPGRSSPLDLSTMLTSVLRAAGVPARIVVCYNTDEGVPQLERLYSIVEFAMLDPMSDQLLWIPIDIERLRDSGRRLSSYKQPWLYFGNHDKLHELVPIGHYYHPPVNYRAFGYPLFYGIRSTPPLDGFTNQLLMIDAQMAPVSGHDFKD